MKEVFERGKKLTDIVFGFDRFFKHAEGYLKRNEVGVEYVPTVDFYHRHNKSYFWMMDQILPFANNVFFRYLLGWAMPPKFSLLKFLRQSLITNEVNAMNNVIQDFGFLLQDLKESLIFVDQQVIKLTS